MKDFKTTISGFVPAFILSIDALIDAYLLGYFDGKTGKQLLISIGLFLIGYFAKDKSKNEQNHRTKSGGAIIPNKAL
jgi:hypothetical protein